MHTTDNVIAQTRDGRTDNVVMAGAHLRSVQEGAGINDNGSGSAALLATAIQMQKVQPNNAVRFAWWGAEEEGQVHRGPRPAPVVALAPSSAPPPADSTF